MPSGYEKSPDYGGGREPPSWYTLLTLALCIGAPVFVVVLGSLKLIHWLLW